MRVARADETDEEGEEGEGEGEGYGYASEGSWHSLQWTEEVIYNVQEVVVVDSDGRTRVMDLVR